MTLADKKNMHIVTLGIVGVASVLPTILLRGYCLLTHRQATNLHLFVSISYIHTMNRYV